MKIRAEEIPVGVPHLSVESFDLVGGVHFYGMLWMRTEHGLVKCAVEHRLSKAEAIRINKEEPPGSPRLAPGDWSPSFESMESLLWHASRIAKEFWGVEFDGGEVPRCWPAAPPPDVVVGEFD